MTAIEKSKHKRLWTGFTRTILFVLSWLALVFLQQKIDAERDGFQRIARFDYLPSGRHLRIASLEFREVTADILWLQAIQFVGGKDPSGRGYDWFYKVIDRVTDLDPPFSYAYQVGGIVLSVLSDRVDLSNAVLKKGLENSPNDWQIPFQLGFNHLYHLKDNLKAAHYMERASKLEGSPAYLPFLTARLYSRGGERQTALILLEGMYRSTHDEKIKERIEQRMKEILNGDDGADQPRMEGSEK